MGAPRSSCAFCAIVAGEADANVVLDQGPTVAFLDRRPLFPGHTLLAPRSHAGRLHRSAPRRMNPAAKTWLPVLHTERGSRHYTVLFSNTPRAHRLGRTDDWTVLYYEQGHAERQYTVATAPSGPLRGRRVVRGREAACAEHYGAIAGP